MDTSFKDNYIILLLFSLCSMSLAGYYGCETVGGMSRNKACIFPFKNLFNGATHNACTHDHGLPAWCATRVNSDGTMPSEDYIGFCGPDCEVEEHATCYASLSKPASNKLEKFSRLRTCVFPFIYKGQEYQQCAPFKRGSNSYPEDSDTPICATAIDDDGTLAEWGYCLSDCPGAGPAKIALTAVGRRESRGTRCVLPFVDDGRWYTQCKPLPHGRQSCATELKADGGIEKDQWAYCDTEDTSECTTVGGAKWGQNCRFPFRSPWSKKMHWNCTTDVLPEAKGSSVLYPNAPWCATNTDAGDMMGATDWGYCSESCPVEKDNFCYADTGTALGELERCIFPFIFNGFKYNRCTEHDGNLKCATKVDDNGVATALNMKTCASPQHCSEKNTVNGSPVSFGYQDVASYTNYGSSCMSVDFEYSTGIEDGTSSSWNVEASVGAEFEYFGAEWGGSFTAGGGGAAESSTSSQVTHSLNYIVGPYTRVTLKQMVAKAGDIKAHTFKIKLVEVLLKSGKEVNAVIPRENTKVWIRGQWIYPWRINGTLVPESNDPCSSNKAGGSSDGGDEGDDEEDEDDEEEDCSNEQYGQRDENGRKNKNCSTQSQEEEDQKKEWDDLGSFEDYFSEEQDDEMKHRSTTTVRTTTSKKRNG